MFSLRSPAGIALQHIEPGISEPTPRTAHHPQPQTEGCFRLRCPAATTRAALQKLPVYIGNR